MIADISAACLTLDFLIYADDEATASLDAVEIVSLAIRDSGARHLGLVPVVEEAHLQSSFNALPGLHTPVWRPRRFLIAEAA